MPKVGLSCPHCHERFEANLSVDSPHPGGTRARNGQISPLTAQALQDILETMQRIGAGRQASTASLLNSYQRVAGDHLRKRMLTRYALIMGLKRYGCEPYRKKYERGYTMPDPIPAEPLPVAQKAAERAEAQLQREFVKSPPPKSSEKPFDPLELIDLPV